MRTQNGHTLQFAEIRLFLQSEFIILNPMFYHTSMVRNLNEI